MSGRDEGLRAALIDALAKAWHDADKHDPIHSIDYLYWQSAEPVVDAMLAYEPLRAALDAVPVQTETAERERLTDHLARAGRLIRTTRRWLDANVYSSDRDGENLDRAATHIDIVYDALRAAAPPAHPDGGLDVERLKRAMSRHEDEQDAELHCCDFGCAAELAAAYDQESGQ